MAVYTDVSFEELETLLAQYDIGSAQSFKGIAEGVENSNFYLQTESGAYILTLYEKRVKEVDLPFFLGLLEHLSARGIACPIPVRDKKGAQWSQLNGRPAAILTFLNGVSLRRPDVPHCAEAGTALAELHSAGAAFGIQRSNALGIGAWPELAKPVIDRADSVQPGTRVLIEETLRQLAGNWPTTLPTGVIHADLFPDNVLFMNGKVSGLIDFYFACDDILAYDLAVMLNAWCFESDGFNITKARALTTAYRKRRPLSNAEIDALPMLAMGAALRFLLTRLYDLLNHDPMALVRPKDPRDYFKRLRFHRTVKDASAYGIT